MSTWIVVAALSYTLGSIPFGYLLVRLFRGEDVRRSGSGNIGATNVARKSPVLGVITLILDALKGTVAVVLSYLVVDRMVAPAPTYEHLAFAGLFAVIGHMFPVWLKFHGGKGVATGLGSFALLAPKATLVAVIVFLCVVAIFRYVSLGSVVAVVFFPFMVWSFRQLGATPLGVAWISVVALLIVFKHRDNLRRLLAGTENRIGKRQA